MSAFLLSQILIGMTIFLNLLSFQYKKRNTILVFLLFSCLLASAHYMLLDRWTAAVILIIAAVRCAVSLYTYSWKVMLFFAGFTVAATVCTFHGWVSLLSCGGVLVGTVGSFCRSDKTLRQLMMLSTLMWIAHNVLVGSPVALCNDFILLGSNLLGYYRFYIRRPRQILR